jgi:site-specific DNA-methyltransferase (adenine-specific)
MCMTMNENTIYSGDSLELLAGWPEGKIDLAFADPPFNIGYVYDKYHDDRPDSEYVEWTRNWMAAVKRVLKPTGSFYIAIGDEFAADIRMIGRDLGLSLRNWIIWRYTFGQNMRTKFSRAHTHIFYFTKHPKQFTFNDHLLRFPSARHTEYQDLRASEQGRLPDDVWDEFPRVCGTFKERAGFHGCQMPEALLMRIVQASSNPGDLVLDPFVGSGTTAVAAQRLGRKYLGIDLSEEYVQHVQNRLEQAKQSDRESQINGMPAIDTEFLIQLYRETKVTLTNLLPNEVALRVIAHSLSQRSGNPYDVEAVTNALEQLASTNSLPKLPNDTPYSARKHVNNEGKRYTRRVTRYRGRKITDSAA